MAKVSPSIIAADSTIFGKEAAAVEAAGADYLHLDVMDGNFVPSVSIGSKVISDLRKSTNLPFDVHLMINQPFRCLKEYADAGADMITIHMEAETHVSRAIKGVKNLGKRAGVSILPTTPPGYLEYVLDYLDIILIMLVDPGFSGQVIMEPQIEKIRQVKAMIGSRPIEIFVDGGVTFNNAKELVAAGADVLVAGTAVFKGDNYKENIDRLKHPR